MVKVSTETEWQPAILRNVHNLENNGHPNQHPDRIRPKLNPPNWYLQERAAQGCNASNFYEVESDGTVCCEHEIFTD